MPLPSDKKDLGKRQLKACREAELMATETDLSADGTKLSQHMTPRRKISHNERYREA